MTISIRSLLGFSFFALAAAGCGVAADPTEAQVAADGTQAMMASSQSTSLASVVFAGVSVTSPLEAAAQLGTAPQLWPAGCVTCAGDPIDPEVVHVTFDDCTGPFGLVHIDGEEVVTFSAGAVGALHVAFTGVNLTANGEPIAHSATADIRFPSSSTRDVVWQGSWTRTNEAGDTVSHISDVNLTVDLASGCSSSSGTAQTHVAGREVETTISGYELCRDSATGAEGCPTGSVTHTGKISNKTVTVTFDASSVAEVTGPRGNSFPVDLVCTPLGK